MASDGDRAGAYDPDITRGLLAEAARLVQAFSFAGEHVTVLGGLVPGLLVPVLEPGLEAHVGTRDLDLCLSVGLLDGDVGNYERLEKCLKNAGFQMARNENHEPISWRWLGGVDVPLTVEFFCPAGPNRPAGRLHRPGGLVGANLSALALAAGGLIDLDAVERIIDVALPARGGTARVRLRVTGIAGYIAAKVDALIRRDKHKDAYDIIWLIEAWPGGPAGAADAVRSSPIFNHPEFRNSLTELRKLFADLDAVGPRRYASFMGQGTGQADALARQAVGAVATLLKAI
ncbi:MAG: hypothetical protein ACKVPX_09090 [Myxococcaceae bacterium]